MFTFGESSLLFSHCVTKSAYRTLYIVNIYSIDYSKYMSMMGIMSWECDMLICLCLKGNRYAHEGSSEV